MFKNRVKKDLAFEESLGDDWAKDLDVAEVPLSNRPLIYLGLTIFSLGILFAFRILYLNFGQSGLYAARAKTNASENQKSPAPRGLIYDRKGAVLAENRGVYSAVLDTKELLSYRELLDETLEAVERILYIPRSQVLSRLEENIAYDFFEPIVLSENLDQRQLVQLKGLDLPPLFVRNDFERQYVDSPVFSSVIGYIGRASRDDLANDSSLGKEDFTGKAGVESFYDKRLRGQPGVVFKTRDARGRVLSEEVKNLPQIGQSLRLTIDAGLQKYFYGSLKERLAFLGRTNGVGLAIDPRNGEVLSMISLPDYDGNILSGAGNGEEKANILNSANKPLFNRAVSGFYNPGSAIKPLVAVSALAEGVIDPQRQIFSPGYLDIPNPYDPEKPTRYLDWRHQGNVNLAAAIAQSSNVYFYTVGGGAGDIKGLGIGRLHQWWEKFNLGKITGIDMPGEASGLLPSVESRTKKTGQAWLLGDTYNVSIGQGDLLLTPLQLLDYISAIGNGGTIYRPVLNVEREHPRVLADLTGLKKEIKEVQKGMRQTVTAPLGTAHSLSDLAFSVGAKTGTAQIKNNAETNAIFVGFAPAENPRVAILVLIENALEGNLNAIPVAKDVLNWYYWNRIKNK